MPAADGLDRTPFPPHGCAHRRRRPSSRAATDSDAESVSHTREPAELRLRLRRRRDIDDRSSREPDGSAVLEDRRPRPSNRDLLVLYRLHRIPASHCVAALTFYPPRWQQEPLNNPGRVKTAARHQRASRSLHTQFDCAAEFEARSRPSIMCISAWPTKYGDRPRLWVAVLPVSSSIAMSSVHGRHCGVIATLPVATASADGTRDSRRERESGLSTADPPVDIAYQQRHSAFALCASRQSGAGQSAPSETSDPNPEG